jgi:UDPglucose--hexose-1-phosphate uridylyltransferase
MSEEKQNKSEKLSELRQDIVTGDWVVIATGRSKRPEDFVARKEEILDTSSSNCPFEDPQASGQKDDVLIYKRSDGEWTLRVFPNLYPAVERGRVPKSKEEGPYFAMTGTGYHEVVVPRDHNKHFAHMDVGEIAEILDAYQDRYLSIMRKKSVRFISIIHNHGKSAGASIHHPHSQIFAIPVISPYIQQELDGAKAYKQRNRRCVYCTMIEYDCEHGERVVFENEDFLVIAPFASRAAFEMWVLPKSHSPYFERLTNAKKLSLAWAFKRAFGALDNLLHNPDYNMYLHTAPCDGSDYPHYHWHFEILPKTSVWAGFELSTGIEICTIAPETAAQKLRESLRS